MSITSRRATALAYLDICLKKIERLSEISTEKIEIIDAIKKDIESAKSSSIETTSKHVSTAFARLAKLRASFQESEAKKMVEEMGTLLGECLNLLKE